MMINHKNALSEAPVEKQSRDLILAVHGTFVVVFVQSGESQHVVFILNSAGAPYRSSVQVDQWL